ncbi:MAG: QueT transporter family protein [Oscillospiraceae bacterium]|nr:QueT transporter family protein [Oscillospiraceae bacterium]
MNVKKTRFIVYAAVIAALYAVLTMALWEFSSLAIQVRLSEALCILPLFTPAAIPGLFIGCAVANILSGTWVDNVFGSLTTLAAAAVTAVIGKRFSLGRRQGLSRPRRWLAPLPAVVFNALVIPFVLYFGYGITSMGSTTATVGVLALMALSVFVGQAIACYVVGIPLMLLLERINDKRRLF